MINLTFEDFRVESRFSKMMSTINSDSIKHVHKKQFQTFQYQFQSVNGLGLNKITKGNRIKYLRTNVIKEK